VIRLNNRNAASSESTRYVSGLSEIAAPRGGNTSLSAKTEAIGSYSVRAMTSKLAAAFDQAINGKPPSISIVLPVYNGERYLQERLTQCDHNHTKTMS